MAATDLLMEVGRPGTATTLSAPGYTSGDTSITVGSTANWPTATGVAFAIDRAEVVEGHEVQIANTYCEFVGEVSSGTDITNVQKVYGIDQDYPAGALTRVYIPVSSERENRIVEWGLASHNQDGTLKDNIVTTAKIADGSVTGAKISSYKITRQNDTTDAVESTARMLTGWGQILTGVSNTVTDDITFATPFTSLPIVLVTYGGDNASASTYGSGGNNVKGSVYAKAINITNANFRVQIGTTDITSWSSGNVVFYQWFAIGA